MSPRFLAILPLAIVGIGAAVIVGCELLGADCHGSGMGFISQCNALAGVQWGVGLIGGVAFLLAFIAFLGGALRAILTEPPRSAETSSRRPHHD
jgi:hypothetical protein